jgi:SH3-like domain-containing protein
MRIFWWVLLGIVLLGFFATQSENTPQSQLTREPNVKVDDASYLFVVGNRVNQRSGPSTTQGVIGQLNQGARVRLVEISGGWTHIVSSLGNGWMSSQYLASTRPPTNLRQPQQPVRQVAVPSNREIRDARAAIIRQSIAGYAGSCPCPYNTDRAGRRCGDRSAWSRPGGYSPTCYDSDVSESRIQTYLARQR